MTQTGAALSIVSIDCVIQLQETIVKMVADLYLRASGQSLLRLLPPTVRESVKKIELAVIRKKYKPLRPAIVYGNPIKKLRGFTLAPNSTVYVIVTDR